MGWDLKEEVRRVEQKRFRTPEFTEQSSLTNRKFCMLDGSLEMARQPLFGVATWGEKGNLREQIQGPLREHETSMTVSSILRADGTWGLSQLSFQFPEEIQDMIMSTPTGLPFNPTDSKIWKFPSFGVYETISTYELICGWDPETRDTSWNWPRRAKVQPRIQHFLWLCCHRKVLIADELMHRGMNIPSRCAICNMLVETIEHILRECPIAQEFWQQLGILGSKQASFRIPIREWIRVNCVGYADLPTGVMAPLESVQPVDI